MEISKNLADQIVNAIFEVVHKNTNLIDPYGIIIGSTDTERIGTYHAAGAYAIEHGVPVFVDKAHPFQGSKNGINHPIFLNDRAIAAIGITGEPEELKQFGFLITKITEVFLKEQEIDREMASRSRALQYFITSLIYDNIRNPHQLDALMKEYRIEPDDEYAALSIKLKDTSLENSLRFYFSSIGCKLALYLYPNEWVALMNRQTFQRFNSDKFTGQYKGQLHAGLGEFGGIYQISHSYNNARIARRHAQSQNMEFCDVASISFEFLLEMIPLNIRQTFANNILKTPSAEELQLLKTYFSYNQSLKDTSEAMYIHKNTLQYRLDRISDRTGLNPRQFHDAFLLQLAVLCLSET